MYKETLENPRFSVGETVLVTQARNCRFGYHPVMDRYVNYEAWIIKMVWSEHHNCYEYTLDVDPRFVWDFDCLEKIENANENFDVDNSAIDEFLSSFIK